MWRFYTSDYTRDNFLLRPIRIRTKFHTLICDYPSVSLYQGLLVYTTQINISSGESDGCGLYIACSRATEFMSLSCSSGGLLNICVVKWLHSDNEAVTCSHIVTSALSICCDGGAERWNDGGSRNKLQGTGGQILKPVKCEIRGYHGGEDDDVVLLGSSGLKRRVNS
jgi:hypothetical protein